MASSSIKLLNTIEWAKRFIGQRQTALGNFNEPALTSANTVLQTIVGAPFAWPWNRAVIGFVCVPGQQDYTIFNWTASTNVSVGTVVVDSNGNSQIVTIAGETGSSIPTWNTTTGLTTVDNGVTWTNSGPIGLSNGSTNYSLGWIESASVKITIPNGGATVWKEIENKVCLGVDSVQSRPHDISAQFIDANGNITFRLMPSPDKAYPVSITIQQRPTLLTGVNSTWSPIPDSYSHIYNWGFLALMYMFTDDTRAQFANQKFVAHLLSTNQGLTDTEKNIWLNSWQSVSGVQIVLPNNIQQGAQAKGAV